MRELYEKLAWRYWWKGMYSDVHRFCQGCLMCAAHGGGGRRTRPPLRSIPVGAPFEQIGVDLMEMPLTVRGSHYVIVFLDYLTKWVEAYPIPDQTSETVARTLVDCVICRHTGTAVKGANLLSTCPSWQDQCNEECHQGSPICLSPWPPVAAK